jgi:hypothetical protein
MKLHEWQVLVEEVQELIILTEELPSQFETPSILLNPIVTKTKVVV